MDEKSETAEDFENFSPSSDEKLDVSAVIDSIQDADEDDAKDTDSVEYRAEYLDDSDTEKNLAENSAAVEVLEDDDEGNEPTESQKLDKDSAEYMEEEFLDDSVGGDTENLVEKNQTEPEVVNNNTEGAVDGVEVLEENENEPEGNQEKNEGSVVELESMKNSNLVLEPVLQQSSQGSDPKVLEELPGVVKESETHLEKPLESLDVQKKSVNKEGAPNDGQTSVNLDGPDAGQTYVSGEKESNATRTSVNEEKEANDAENPKLICEEALDEISSAQDTDTLDKQPSEAENNLTKEGDNTADTPAESIPMTKIKTELEEGFCSDGQSASVDIKPVISVKNEETDFLPHWSDDTASATDGTSPNTERRRRTKRTPRRKQFPEEIYDVTSDGPDNEQQDEDEHYHPHQPVRVKKKGRPRKNVLLLHKTPVTAKSQNRGGKVSKKNRVWEHVDLRPLTPSPPPRPRIWARPTVELTRIHLSDNEDLPENTRPIGSFFRPPTSRYVRRIPDEYFLAKYRVRPAYVALHDLSEYSIKRKIPLLERQLKWCFTCRMTREPRKKKTIQCVSLTKEPEPPAVATGVSMLINPLPDANTVLVKITQNDVTSSFVMNRKGYSTFASRLSASSTINLPLNMRVANFQFPAGFEWKKHLPPTAPLTPAQKNNILKRISKKVINDTTPVQTERILKRLSGSGVTVTPPKMAKLSLKESQKNMVAPPGPSSQKAKSSPLSVNGVPVWPLQSKVITSSSNKRVSTVEGNGGTTTVDLTEEPPTKKQDGGEMVLKLNQLQCCVSCSRVFRANQGHVCPSKPNKPQRAKRKPDVPKTPAAPRKGRKILAPSPPPEVDSIVVDSASVLQMCAQCNVVFSIAETHHCTKKDESKKQFYQICSLCMKIYLEGDDHVCPKNPEEVLKSLIPAEPEKKEKKSQTGETEKINSSEPPKVQDPDVSMPTLDFDIFECTSCKETFSSDIKHVCKPKVKAKLPKLAPKPVSPTKATFSMLNQVHKCIRCFKFYKDEISLNSHVCRVATNPPDLQCTLCSKRYKNFETHDCPKKEPVAKKNIYQCELCQKILAPGEDHNCQDGSNSFRCKKCPFVTKSRALYFKHECSTSPKVTKPAIKDIFRCSGCPKMFSKQEFLEKHQMTLCPKLKEKMCTKCGVLVNLGDFSKHECAVEEVTSASPTIKAPSVSQTAVDLKPPPPVIVVNMNAVNEQANAVRCRKCKSFFASWDLLKVHDATAH